MTIEQIKTLLKSTPDIIGKSKYLNTAVLIPLFYVDDELHILFEKRANSIRQGGEVSFPGGEFCNEVDNSLLDTAIRETCEELGLHKNKVEVLNKFGTLVAPMGLTIDAYAAILKINSLNDCNPDKTEVEELFTFPLRYFIDNEPEIYYSKLEIHTSETDEQGKILEMLPVAQLGLPQNYAKPWKGKYRVVVYKTLPNIIWGLTAEIVYEFCKIIKNIR